MARRWPCMAAQGSAQNSPKPSDHPVPSFTFVVWSLT
jgi:hypothetical protein